MNFEYLKNQFYCHNVTILTANRTYNGFLANMGDDVIELVSPEINGDIKTYPLSISIRYIEGITKRD